MPTKITFAEGAVFWSALYHLMFKADRESMTRAVLTTNLRKVSTLFGTEIGCYGLSRSRKSGFLRDILRT